MSSISNKGMVEEKRSSNIKAISTAILALSIGGCMGGGSGSMRRDGGVVGGNPITATSALNSLVSDYAVADLIAREAGLTGSSNQYTVERDSQGRLVLHYADLSFDDLGTNPAYERLRTLRDDGKVEITEGSIIVTATDDYALKKSIATLKNTFDGSELLRIEALDAGGNVVADANNAVSARIASPDVQGFYLSLDNFREEQDGVIKASDKKDNVTVYDTTKEVGGNRLKLVITGANENEIRATANSLGVLYEMVGDIDGQRVARIATTFSDREVFETLINDERVSVMRNESQLNCDLSCNKSQFLNNPDQYDNITRELRLYGKTAGLQYSNFGVFRDSVSVNGKVNFSDEGVFYGSDVNRKGCLGTWQCVGATVPLVEEGDFTGKTFALVSDEEGRYKELSGDATLNLNGSRAKLDLDFRGQWHNVEVVATSSTVNATFSGNYNGNLNVNAYLADGNINTNSDYHTQINTNMQYYGGQYTGSNNITETVGDYELKFDHRVGGSEFEDDIKFVGVFGVKR